MTWSLTPGRVETGFWLLVCGGLLAGIGVETDWGRQFGPPAYSPVEAQSNFEKPVLAEPFHLPSPDTMLETATRPLFVVTRRPAPPPVAEVPVPTMNKGQFTLTGVTIVPNAKFAFLVEKAGNKNRVVAEGNEINGLLVKEVLATQVTLTQNNDSEVLPLKPAKGPNVPPPPSGAQGVPPADGIPTNIPRRPLPAGNSPNESAVTTPAPPAPQSAPPKNPPGAVSTRPTTSVAGPR